MIKIIKLTNKGVCLEEVKQITSKLNEPEVVFAYVVEQIAEKLYESIVPARERFEFDFEKEVVYPPEGEIVELRVMIPSDFDGTNIMQIEVTNLESLNSDYRDTAVILIGEIADELVAKAESGEL